MLYQWKLGVPEKTSSALINMKIFKFESDTIASINLIFIYIFITLSKALINILNARRHDWDGIYPHSKYVTFYMDKPYTGLNPGPLDHTPTCDWLAAVLPQTYCPHSQR